MTKQTMAIYNEEDTNHTQHADFISYIEPDTTSNDNLLEALADIAYTAGQENYRVEDSRQVISNLIDWAKEFDALHKHTDWNEVDYIETVDAFAYEKIRGLTVRKP